MGYGTGEVEELRQDLAALRSAHPQVKEIAMFHQEAPEKKGAQEIYLTPAVARLAPRIIAKYRAHPADRPQWANRLPEIGGVEAYPMF